MIPIFIASSDRFADAEWLTEFSILENTNEEVKIYIVRPQWYGMEASGCTGFTNVRYAIPQLCRLFGYDYGIYLDVDMIVTGDIKDLWAYRKAFNWVCLEDGSNEVSVVCSTLQFPDKSVLHTRHKSTLHGARLSNIPLEWNSKDKVCPNMKLLHFTALANQPWFHDHPNSEAVALYEEYLARYLQKDSSAGNIQRQ
jgi:lipopolysaccharide biosynthesis glycosyltransferase